MLTKGKMTVFHGQAPGAHRVLDHVRSDPPARGADAALEAVRDHSRAAADVAFGNDTAACRVERLEDVRPGHVLAKPVVEEGIGGFANDRLMPRNLTLRDLLEPGIDGVADGSH